MEKKLSKTEKIKRLRAIQKAVLKAERREYFYMCHFYSDNYGGYLFNDIPELYKYRPKESMLDNSDKSEAWTFNHTKLSDAEGKKRAIDKAIKFIQAL